jgi:hypothetical protein
VESKILQAKRGLPSIGIKNLTLARQYARQLLSEGADEVKIIENSTGILVKKYTAASIRKERTG